MFLPIPIGAQWTRLLYRCVRERQKYRRCPGAFEITLTDTTLSGGFLCFSKGENINWYDCFLSETKKTGFICTFSLLDKKHRFYGLNDLQGLIRTSKIGLEDILYI